MRLILAMLLALALVGGARGETVAGEEWCEIDPLVVVQTPGGARVPLFVSTGAESLLHLVSVTLAKIDYTAEPTQDGAATLVSMTVTVPRGLGLGDTAYRTRSVVSTGPLKTGTILAWAEGVSGSAMSMEFTLDKP